MSLKQRALQLIRRAHLLETADAARFRWMARDSAAARAAFARTYGDVPLPPDGVAYDAYGTLDWQFYWGFGQLIAAFLAPRIQAQAAGGRVLEWGCGPARIIRHLPALLGPAWHVTGIRREREHDPVVRGASARNRVRRERRGAPLAVRRGYVRLRLRGVGVHAPFEPVVRGEVTGGTRCFVAYHPPSFVRADLLRDFDVLEHLPAPNVFGERQDVWIGKSESVPSRHASQNRSS